ncbi:class I SAM-dependent methyltransferase [Clostridium sp. D2Q-14]|uniref:class I SAM-dependent methyltransferase n=1 Tax=Anaeromonas gelatinilytica TaxID=2683194 RepID=UPI00193B7FC2|nr:class I SAM-dependent methyltransferase [Anaeromonas gelatinilytica]MBS4534599.1 class I SAM-dependent methyltransferase [Anaeromonas gelatinilytica]
MLKSKIQTQEEIETYMKELKEWLESVKNATTEEMTDFFTKRINEYDNVHLTHWGKEYAHIADFFDNGLNSLLDIGCGTGLELESMYKRFPKVKVTGIDLSESMLNKLREKYRYKDISIIKADYFEYPFEENKFDAAMSFETLHHFKYQKKQKIYNKLYQTIKNGGYYIECDYIACCNEEETLCLEGYEYRRKKNNIPDDVFIHIDIPLTLEHQIELMKNAGFQTVDVLYQNGGTVIFKAKKQ